MSNKKKQFYSPELKLELLKAHLVDKKNVTDLCQSHGIKPSLFYLWQQELFKDAHRLFGPQEHTKIIGRYKKSIIELESALAQKDRIIAEVMQDYLSLKKGFGETLKGAGYAKRSVMKW